MQLFAGYAQHAVTLLGGYLAVLGAVLCLSCGLYYAAELAEEHSVLTGKLLRKATVGVLAGAFAAFKASSTGHVLLWLDGFPFGRVFLGAACHVCYAWLLNDYPRLELASPAFAASVVAFLVDHYSWFSHLGDPYVAPLPFVNSLGFFTLFVWLVPFSLFVSLSINDNELPLGRPEAPRSSTAFRRLADWIREAYAEAFRAGAQAAAPRTHDKFY